jgi:hypothetical protein
MPAAALTCPECGAANAVAPGARVARCPGCGVSSAVLGVGEAPQLWVKPALDSAAAARAAKSWLHGARVREGTTLRADFTAPKLQLLPFLRVEADVLGWLFGQRKHSDDKGHVYWTDEELEIAEPHDQALPLCDAGESGVYRLPPLDGVPSLPFDEAEAARLGELVPALDSDDTIEERVRDEWLAAARAHHQLDRITGQEISLVGVAQSVVHYPFWRIAYRYGGGDYVVMVDARTGEIAAGKAPGSFLVGALIFAGLMPVAAAVMVAGCVLAGLLVYAAFAVADASDTLAGAIGFGALAVGGGAIALGSLLARAGHRSLRYGGEVESGYGVRPDAGLFEEERDASFRRARAEERAEIEADSRLRT